MFKKGSKNVAEICEKSVVFTREDNTSVNRRSLYCLSFTNLMNTIHYITLNLDLK